MIDGSRYRSSNAHPHLTYSRSSILPTICDSHFGVVVSILPRVCTVMKPKSQVVMEETSEEVVEILEGYHLACRDIFVDNLTCVKDILGPSGESDQALERSGQWPRITTEALFRCVASTSLIKLTGPWKKCLVRLALFLLELQRTRSTSSCSRRPPRGVLQGA